MPRLTVTLPGDLMAEVRARAGRRGVSSWIAQAAAERLAREQLSAAIAEYEADAGPITEEDIAAARARTAWQPTAARSTARQPTVRRRKPPAA